MVENIFKFTISTNKERCPIEIDNKKILFILGANGTGKSALIHNIFSQSPEKSKIISAHRRSWFDSNSSDLNLNNYENIIREKNIFNKSLESRFKEYLSYEDYKFTIFNLINCENKRAQNIAYKVDSKDIESAKDFSDNHKSILVQISNIFKKSNINIEFTIDNGYYIMASKNGSHPYSIAKLSDGERNAFLICSDVLTANKGSVLIIDEPEKHLHRSIISPMLKELFESRNDCIFIISTHEINLPLVHNNAEILLLRGCEGFEEQEEEHGNINHGHENEIKWDFDIVKDVNEIDDNLKKDILGPKRNLLFIEGQENSLDVPLYKSIFPKMTIIPKGSCAEVEKVVKGLNASNKYSWLNVFGLIDSDDRTNEQKEKLLEKNIATIDSYSIEALYYNLDILELMAIKFHDFFGEETQNIIKKSTEKLIDKFQENQNNLCARLCQRKVQNEILNKLPSYKEILEEDEFNETINYNKFLNEEKNIFSEFIANDDINRLILRYPIKNTNIPSLIAQGFGVSKDQYEKSVIQLVLDDENAKKIIKNLIKPLSELIQDKI